MNYVISPSKYVLAIAGLGLVFQAISPSVARADFVQDAYERTLKPSTSAPASVTPSPANKGNRVTPKGSSGHVQPMPPKNGGYVTRRGAASRGCGSAKTLLPLAPSEQLNDQGAIIPKLSTGGFTTQAYPSFWFQVPFSATEVESLEFVLQDDNDNNLYRIALDVDLQSDLVQAVLPVDEPGLALGQRYRWILKARLNCGVDGLVADQPPVKGWIRRYEPEASLLSQLAAATPLQQAQLYADAGVWFDALNILAPLQGMELQDAASQVAWQDLLKLYAIDLQPDE